MQIQIPLVVRLHCDIANHVNAEGVVTAIPKNKKQLYRFRSGWLKGRAKALEG